VTRIPQDIADFLEGGLSIVVGSADAGARPDCTRAAGLRIDRAANRITVYLPTVGADRTLANLAANGRVAVTFSRPYDNRSCQLKGRVCAVAPTSADEQAQQQRWLAAFVEQLAMVGIARSVTRRWRLTPSVAVEIDVEELYEQTPGPGAGKRIGV
jgi:hypothetical protein